MTATAATTLATTLSGTLVNSITSSTSNQSAANTALAGLVQNLAGASSTTGILSVCDQIMRTPNAGAAAAVAEVIVNDITPTSPSYIADATYRAVVVQGKISVLQSIVNTQTHATGLISGLLAQIGL